MSKKQSGTGIPDNQAGTKTKLCKLSDCQKLNNQDGFSILIYK